MSEIKTIAVHNGLFHADDVFSIAILKLIYPNVHVIRTRDSELIKHADLKVDVGGEYDPKKGKFDHHQIGGAGVRKNGIPYASVGLIWKSYGNDIVKNEWVLEYIDKRVIQYIDADDCGVDSYNCIKMDPYTIADIIESLNCNNAKNKEDYDPPFFEAVDFAIKLVKKEIERAHNIYEAREKVLQLKDKVGKSEYLILEEKIYWYESVINETNFKFVVDPNSSGDWGVSAVPKTLGSFESRSLLPKKWRGLFGENLAKVTQVKDAVFCHNNGVFAAAKTKEGAIRLVEMALKEDD